MGDGDVGQNGGVGRERYKMTIGTERGSWVSLSGLFAFRQADDRRSQ